VDLTYARLLVNWKVIRKIRLGTSFQYEHGSLLAVSGEVFDRYGTGISLGRPVTAKLNAGLGYQFYWRTSDQVGRNYTDNSVTLNLNYTF
jgi:outer membrane protein assembly factor BamA